MSKGNISSKRKYSSRLESYRPENIGIVVFRNEISLVIGLLGTLPISLTHSDREINFFLNIFYVYDPIELKISTIVNNIKTLIFLFLAYDLKGH